MNKRLEKQEFESFLDDLSEDTSKNNEPIFNTLDHFEVCQKVSINFDTACNPLKYDIYFKKKYMWGAGL